MSAHPHAAHPSHAQGAQPSHPAVEQAQAAQTMAEIAAARPEIPAPEHANENTLPEAAAAAEDLTRAPVKPPETLVPPEVKLPELPAPEAPHAAAPEVPTDTSRMHNVYVMPQVFEAAKVKLFASLLPPIEKIDQQLTEGMKLELSNELIDPASEQGAALKITLSGKTIAANYAVIAKSVNDTLNAHPVLGPVLHGDKTHTLNHLTHADGSSELQLVIPGLSSAQYAQLVQAIAGTAPLTQVNAPAQHHQTLVSAPAHGASM